MAISRLSGSAPGGIRKCATGRECKAWGCREAFRVPHNELIVAKLPRGTLIDALFSVSVMGDTFLCYWLLRGDNPNTGGHDRDLHRLCGYPAN